MSQVNLVDLFNALPQSQRDELILLAFSHLSASSSGSGCVFERLASRHRSQFKALSEDVIASYESLRKSRSPKGGGGGVSVSDARELGYKLEQLSFVLFSGLPFAKTAKVWGGSAGFQLDLVIAGDQPFWAAQVSAISSRTIGDPLIVVECKATQEPVDEQQFSRFCSILHQNLSSYVGVGVFVSLSGFSGGDTTCLKAAKLRQYTFFIKTGIPVIVIDIDDLRALASESVSMFHLMRNKVREIASLTTQGDSKPDGTYEEKPLPTHLTDVMQSW